MPTDTFEPIPTGSGGGGDVEIQTNASSALIFPYTGSVLAMIRSSGKTPTEYGFAMRFELDIAAGAVIDGMRVTMTVKSTTGGASTQWRTAMLADDDDWTDAIGWKHANYTNSGDIPHTTYVNTNIYNWSDDPALYSANDTLRIADGTLSGDHDIVGLLADLQDAFDANPRDLGVGDGVPVAVLFRRDQAIDARFDFYDEGDATRKPTLEVAYEDGIAPVVVISSPPSATLTTSIFATETFTATSIDNVDGDISSAIVWTSDVDGALGTAASINVAMNTLTPGTHTITATSTDTTGNDGTDTFTLIVQDVMSIDRHRATTKPTFTGRSSMAATLTARAAITLQTFAARASTKATMKSQATTKPTFSARASIQ